MPGSAILPRPLACVAVLLALAPAPVAGAGPPATASSLAPATGTLSGVVTTQGGALRLPGVALVVEAERADGTRGALARTESGDDGRFEIEGLPPGRLRVTARLQGLRELTRVIVLAAGRGPELALDLEIAGTSERVDVSSGSGLDRGLRSQQLAGSVDLSQPQTAPQGDAGVEASLALVPGVVRGPGGISVKGGRPTQSALLLGAIDLGDPATGEASLRLPADAVSSIEVLPSPVAAEFGRFSSGAAVVRAKRGRDAWRATLASVNPAFATERGDPLHLIGVESFSPRFSLRGPLGGRVQLAQSLQYRFSSRDVRSRPQDERKRTEGVGAFTRLDAVLGRRHTLTATALAFVEARDRETLGAFDPPEVTASRRQHVFDLAVSEGASFGRDASLESTLHAKLYDVDVRPQGSGPMQLWPGQRQGSYFGRQAREAWALQWREALSGTQQLGGTHSWKAGVDLLRQSFEGSSESAPVEVWRASGTLASRTVFEPARDARARATDLSLFAQDRWQPGEPVVLEAGLRVDRVGIAGAWVVSPRLGTRVRLLPGGRLTLGAGVGRFVESVPLATGSPRWIEPRTVALFDDDGKTPGEERRFAPRLGPGGLAPPRALSGHLEAELRLNASVSLRSHVLARRGEREHVLLQEVAAGAGWLTLDASGRSRYRELALGFRATHGQRLTLDLSYARSSSRADVNAAAAFLGTLREPLLRPNAFARAAFDAPNRVLAQLRGSSGDWRWAGLFEWRDGLPYSGYDELQRYVERPNEAGRVPAFASLDASLERRLRLGPLRPWVGLQLFNVLGRFNPQDVQRNVDAPDFGALYDSEPFRARLSLRL